MKLEKAWMTFGIITFLSQIASLMLDASGFISVLVLGLFVVGCGLCFASFFKLVHRFTTSMQLRAPSSSVPKEGVTMAKPETNLKAQMDKTANLEPATSNQEVKVIENTEESEWRTKLERALRVEGGE